MTLNNCSPLTGRPTKRKRSGAELQELARDLGADWAQGDTVQTWLHKHEGKARELSRIVDQGWSWEDLGKAMHLAGIGYRTGEPISANTLRHKAYLSRNRERDRLAAKAARKDRDSTPRMTPGVEIPASAPLSQVPAPLKEATQNAPDEPVFQLVTLRRVQHTPTPQETLASPIIDRSGITEVSDDEILRRVFGKPKT